MDKKAAVRRLGACKKCPEVHDDGSFCKPTYPCKNPNCKVEHVPEHHYYPCPNAEMKKRSTGHKKTDSIQVKTKAEASTQRIKRSS